LSQPGRGPLPANSLKPPMPDRDAVDDWASIPELDDETLLRAWPEAMDTTTRALLRAEFHRRGLAVPPLPEGAEDDLKPPTGRLLWWSWMQGYGLFAPAAVLSMRPVWWGVHFDAIWLLVFGVAGFLLSVWWLLHTQSRPHPWSRSRSIGTFLVLHAALIGLLAVFVAVTGRLGEAGGL